MDHDYLRTRNSDRKRYVSSGLIAPYQHQHLSPFKASANVLLSLREHGYHRPQAGREPFRLWAGPAFCDHQIGFLRKFEEDAFVLDFVAVFPLTTIRNTMFDDNRLRSLDFPHSLS